jgi:hypothetical protein
MLCTVRLQLQGDRVLKKNFESGNEAAERLCQLLEAIFLLELKNDSGQLWREAKKPNMLHPPQPSFWTFVDPMVSDEVKMQLMALRDSESDVMKCRSWLRIMLNKSLLVSFLEDLQRHPGLLAFHYGSDSLLRDGEQLEIVIQFLKGLTTIQLGYDYTNPGLTTWDNSVLHMVGIWLGSPSPRPRRERERVSPPPSSLGLEGVAVINLALNRYSNVSSNSSRVTDAQLIQEATEQMSEEKGSQVSSGSSQQNCNGSHGNEEGGSADFSYAMSLDFEVVSENTPTPTPSLTLTSLLTKLVPERGLDSQNYLCAACGRPIGVIFGQSKLCKYNGQHYCYDCHIDDERVIPARVLFNWDFRKHRVCRASCEFLDSISEAAVLNMEESNPALYMYIPEMEEAQKLRQQLNSLRGYLTTCRDTASLELFQKRLKSPHLYEEIHSYSIQDLVEVHSGALQERMRRAFKIGAKHVKECALCSQKGFICEGCHGDNILYPFNLHDTYQCQSCRALFHLSCQPPKGQCSKCLRIRKRREALMTDNG